MLKGKHIILGITGSIAAYKAAQKRGRSTSCYHSSRKRIHHSDNFIGIEQ